MTTEPTFGVFGALLPDIADVPADATQCEPIIPGAFALEDVKPASLAGMIMLAPPGTLERRYALALAVRALKPGGALTAMAPKDKGGNRIAKELESFGCTVEVSSRRHQRVSRTTRPSSFDATAQASMDDAISAGGPRALNDIGLHSQPGVFSWDRIDPGTALLLSVMPPLSGRGADLGCGIGVIARAVLASSAVTHLDLFDIDRRAISAARLNIDDNRAVLHWADVRKIAGLKDLDFVVMNPPFHDGGHEDRALGQAFIQQCHRILRDGGTAWLVANLHLPYEAVLSAAFSQVSLRAEAGGFKVYEATK